MTTREDAVTALLSPGERIACKSWELFTWREKLKWMLKLCWRGFIQGFRSGR